MKAHKNASFLAPASEGATWTENGQYVPSWAKYGAKYGVVIKKEKRCDETLGFQYKTGKQDKRGSAYAESFGPRMEPGWQSHQKR